MKIKFIHILFLAGICLLGFSSHQTFDLEASMQRGQEIYFGQCAMCHMAKGEGIPTVYPPLAKSDFLMKETEKSIIMILQGGSELITVNGVDYDGAMPNFNLSDEQVSDVMNYIRNTWGNTGEAIKPEHIKAIRKKGL